MKKISVFLAAIMMFVMVAASGGNVETVQAMESVEIDHSESLWFKSAKAGTNIYFGYNIDYSQAASTDVTGWKAALCPADNLTLAGAVATFELSNSNKNINDEYQWATVYINATLPNAIPEGTYVKAFFDAAGDLVYADSLNDDLYINKTIVTASCWLMNDDGYAYAYVYSESPAINASTYPTFYATDKTTAVTSFSDYTVGKSEYGETVHYYKLNILDKSQFSLNENGVTYLYYSMGTPNLSSGNDGGVGLWRCNANGIGWTSACDLNTLVEKYPDLYEMVDPFATSSSESQEVEYVPMPVEQEVVLPSGEEVRMINVKGNPYVYIIGNPEVVPTGATFKNSQIIVGDGYTLPVAAVEKYVGKGLEVAVYQMDLLSAEGVAITQLGDYINVTLPIPADITLDEGKTIVMYRYEDNGTLTRCNTVVDGNMVTFATNHFSFYVMVEQDASAGPSLVTGTSGASSTTTSPKTADMNMLPAMMTAIAGMGIAVVAMRKKNEI